MRIYIETLGCPKNVSDSEYAAGLLTEAGHAMVSDPGEAEAIIVNSCGFINDAKEESIDRILELEKPFELEEVKELLASFPGCVVLDDPANNVYPLARQVAGKDEVFVGRIRRDFSVENGLNLWVVADNIRKGAATNAVQIAELLIK
jgi:tRNA A37 methylthiotransferase MiaB